MNNKRQESFGAILEAGYAEEKTAGKCKEGAIKLNSLVYANGKNYYMISGV